MGPHFSVALSSYGNFSYWQLLVIYKGKITSFSFELHVSTVGSSIVVNCNMDLEMILIYTNVNNCQN